MVASTTSIKLDNDLKERIQRLAESQKRTAHWVMKEAIGEYVEREERRELFLREAMESWEDYQATGLHVTGEEIDEWLAKIERGEKAEPPECHE